MQYQLPQGIISAQDLKFPDALNIPKRPIKARGFPISAKGMGPTLGIKIKKWGNGTNNSGTRNKKSRH